MSESITFVIGAGASNEVNLPIGQSLKEIIAELLDIRFKNFRLFSGDYKILEAFRIHAKVSENSNDVNPYLFESWHIRDALPQAISIDNFLDTQRGNERMALCGKLGIVRSILDAEGDSLLYFERTSADSKIDFKAIVNTWYTPFFQLLTENCTKDDLNERLSNVTLIVFNYDRCIEHFLFYALQNQYRISPEEAAQLVKGITIYHPYGTVGSLPWMDRVEGIEFGAEPNANKLLTLAGKIKTFTEGTDPSSSEVDQIRTHIENSAKVVFLGFAFHRLNMELISPSLKTHNRYVKCFATTKGISKDDSKIIEDHINGMYGGYIETKTSNSSCNDFFKEFWRSLSF